MLAHLARDRVGRSARAPDHGVRIAKYDAGWATYLARLGQGVARGATLAELIQSYDRFCGTYSGFVMAPVAGQLARIDLGRYADEPEPFRLVVREGRYQSAPAAPGMGALFKLIASYIDDEVDCVVEFGSGIGVNLARLRTLRPDADVTYIACEPTASGREATRMMFQTDPHARIEVRPFDYADDDLAFLGRFRRVVAFTCHSVEQVPVLGEAFYRRLIASSVARCVHIEPVGWQRFTDIATFVRVAHYRGPPRQRLTDEYVFTLDDAKLIDNAAAWSALCCYNTDLLSLIAAATTRGEVAIDALKYEIVGSNPFNPSTLIAWKK